MELYAIDSDVLMKIWVSILFIYGPYKVVCLISKLILAAYKKWIIPKSLILFKMKYIIYLMIDNILFLSLWLILVFINLMGKWT